MNPAQTGLKKWHKVMEGGNAPAALAAIIAEDAAFHSPVVHTPQQGRALVVAYLAAAGQVFADSQFTYQREIVDGNQAMLEFTAEIDGVHINGVDIIQFDDGGMIKDFKVMVRPLKAVNKLWKMMAAQLQAAQAHPSKA
ncbi:MAG: nuclear transport factor 2 family protein [Sphingomonadaceae bacterium]|nr:nuclear transport factor 2 family protein [Sphingomonadaceae bacterium]